MTTLLGDAICNIEDEEYWEACQHTLKSSYELRANNEDQERGAAPSEDEGGSDDKSDRSSDSSSNDNGLDDDDSRTDSNDNSNRSYDSLYSSDDQGEPPSDTEDEDADLFYKEYDSNVAYYDEDIEDDAKANRWSDTNSDQYRLINMLENAREENAHANQMYHGHLSDWNDITNVNSRYGPRYDKQGREVLELGSYYDLEPRSPIPHTEKEDDIDARLATLE